LAKPHELDVTELALRDRYENAGPGGAGWLPSNAGWLPSM
jgi:hypothetical protein